MDVEREFLRHFLAGLAYRTQKALRGAPAEFAEFAAGEQTRTPKELVRHMTSVLGYARTFFTGGSYRPEPLPSMSEEIARFHEVLEDLGRHLASDEPFLDGMTSRRMLHGPFSDAMTHAGQLALLRRLAGVQRLLRMRVGEAIARKRTPELAFVVVPVGRAAPEASLGEEGGAP